MFDKHSTKEEISSDFETETYGTHDALDLITDNLKENISYEISLLEKVYQSTMDLAETMKETSQGCERLKATLEMSDKLIKSSDELIKGFTENRKLAKEDRRLAKEDRKRHEETMQELEKNEREFQEALKRLMYIEQGYIHPELLH